MVIAACVLGVSVNSLWSSKMSVDSFYKSIADT